jgi:hypothetical protein
MAVPVLCSIKIHFSKAEHYSHIRYQLWMKIRSAYIMWTFSLYVLYIALQPFGPWPLFQFLNLYTVGRTPWTVDQPVARRLHTQRTAQTQNKRTQTSMPRMGFEPTIPVLKRKKTVHALDRAATLIGTVNITDQFLSGTVVTPAAILALHEGDSFIRVNLCLQWSYP